MLGHINEQESDYVLSSKKRCRDLGMNPDIINLPQNAMSESELAKRKEKYREILDVVTFFSEKILKSLEGTPILIGISDEKGYILDLLGDETIRATTEKLSIKPGVQYTEEYVGTNVVTLALKQGHPVQVIGTDHYHTHLHNSACYGVPFYYSDSNKLLGTICIMTGVILHNPFFLMTLTNVVDAIERELLLRKQNRRISEQQKRLYRAEKKQRKLLEKDLVMKNEFITLMTHEFKTPINVIYSAIQLIECVYMDKIPDKVRYLIESIKVNTFRQLRIVNNMLDIARLNSNQFNLNLRKLEIVSLTQSIIKSVGIYAVQKDIKLNFKTSIISKHMVIDEEKYERVILNLLSNAIKFTENGGNIAIELKENGENTISIAVKDDGIGIPKEKYEKIFERFGQVDSNLSRQAEGSGIGLALVKMLVSAMDGEIIVDSQVGVGSTFTIMLPIREEDIKENDSPCLDSDSRLLNAINIEFSDIYF